MPGRTDLTKPPSNGSVVPASIAPSNALVQRFTQRIQHSDLVAGAATEAVALAGFPTNAIVLIAVVDLKTEFSGGGVGLCNVAIGDAGDEDELCDNTDVFTGAGAGLKHTNGAAVISPRFEAAYSPRALFSVDTTTAALTAGDLWVHIYYCPVVAV